MKKFLLICLGLLLVGTNVAFAESCPIKIDQCACQKECNYPKEALRYKKYMKTIQQERATVYNALNLTDEQIKLRENMINENSSLYDAKFNELIKESYKVKALKQAGATDREIANQKKVVRNVKKDIESLVNKENKQFKKSLNHDQRAKYAMIKKLEKNDFKEAAHQKDYYKSNPQMRPFGNPRPCPCPMGSVEDK